MFWPRMVSMRVLRHIVFGVGGWLLVGTMALSAQQIQINAESVPLETVISQIETQAGIRVVRAERLTRNLLVSFSYTGVDVVEAFAQLLHDTGLELVVVRGRQYVLAKAPPPTPSPDVTLKRGSIVGFIEDAETGDLLINAHIYLPELGLGTVTDIGGYFSIRDLPLGYYRARITYVGYQPLEVDLQAGALSSRIQLAPAAFAAEELLVIGQDEAGSTGDVPGATTVRLQQEAAMPSPWGERDPLQALQWLPHVRRTNETGGELIIRGGQPDQNRYLLDGAPLYQPWHAFHFFSALQTEALDEIRLYKGAYPAALDGALSAIVDAGLRDGTGPKPTSMIALGPAALRFVATRPMESNIAFMAAGRLSLSNLNTYINFFEPQTASLGGIRADTLSANYNFYDVTAKLTYKPSRWHEFALGFFRAENQSDVSGIRFEPVTIDQVPQVQSEVGYNFDRDWTTQVLNLQYEYLYGQSLFVTAQVYGSSYEGREQTLLQPDDDSIIFADYRIRLNDVGLKANADYFFSLAHQLSFGVQAARRHFDGRLEADLNLPAGTTETFDRPTSTQVVETAAYIEDTWQVSPRTQLLLGLRVSRLDLEERVRILPRLHFRYTDPDGHWVIRGGWSEQVQYIHRLRSQNPFRFEVISQRWLSASKTLRPAAGWQAALGGEFSPTPWLRFMIEGYWRNFEHVLVPDADYTFGTTLPGAGIENGVLLEQITAHDLRAYGFEFSGLAEHGAWQYWASYAWGRSLWRRPNVLAFAPSIYDVPHQVNAAVRWSNEQWVMTLTGEWRTGEWASVATAAYGITDVLGQTQTYPYLAQTNNQRLPAYVRFDLAVGYQFQQFGLDWQAQLQIFNLSNRTNVTARSVLPGPPATTVDQHGWPFFPVLDLKIGW